MGTPEGPNSPPISDGEQCYPCDGTGQITGLAYSDTGTGFVEKTWTCEACLGTGKEKPA